MKHEMELVKQNHLLFGVPVRDTFDPRVPQDEIRLRHRLVREESDETIEALLTLNLVQIADGLCDIMVVTAGTNVQLGTEPTSHHFAQAAKELLEDARLVAIQGLTLRQPMDIAIGTVMLEIVCKGIAGCLNLPYTELFTEVHTNNMGKVGEDGKPIFDKGGKFLKPAGWKPPRIREILEAHGLVAKQEDLPNGPANDA